MRKLFYYAILCMCIGFCLSCNLDNKQEKQSGKDYTMKISISGGLDDRFMLVINSENNHSLTIYKCKATNKDSCENYEVQLSDEELASIYTCLNHTITSFRFPEKNAYINDGEFVTFLMEHNQATKSISCNSEYIAKSESYPEVKKLKELLNKKLEAKYKINWLNY